MPLLDFQTALGRSVQGGLAEPLHGLVLSDRERRAITRIAASAGFGATRAIQRSWCEGRAAHAARLTLSMLPLAERQRLIAKWVAQGGGTRSFLSSEAEAFLDFIAAHLPDPSHALTLARLEQAVHRALAASLEPCTAPPQGAGAVLCRGRHAAMVRFYAEPRRLLAAVEHREPLPPLAERPTLVLFAPRLPCLFRPASAEEARLWESLARPASVAMLLRRGHDRETIASLTGAGAAEACADEAAGIG